jgi:hypothetical protein
MGAGIANISQTPLKVSEGHAGSSLSQADKDYNLVLSIFNGRPSNEFKLSDLANVKTLIFGGKSQSQNVMAALFDDIKNTKGEERTTRINAILCAAQDYFSSSGALAVTNGPKQIFNFVDSLPSSAKTQQIEASLATLNSLIKLSNGDIDGAYYSSRDGVEKALSTGDSSTFSRAAIVRCAALGASRHTQPQDITPLREQYEKMLPTEMDPKLRATALKPFLEAEYLALNRAVDRPGGNANEAQFLDIKECLRNVDLALGNDPKLPSISRELNGFRDLYHNKLDLLALLVTVLPIGGAIKGAASNGGFGGGALNFSKSFNFGPELAFARTGPSTRLPRPLPQKQGPLYPPAGTGTGLPNRLHMDDHSGPGNLTPPVSGPKSTAPDTLSSNSVCLPQHAADAPKGRRYEVLYERRGRIEITRYRDDKPEGSVRSSHKANADPTEPISDVLELSTKERGALSSLYKHVRMREAADSQFDAAKYFKDLLSEFISYVRPRGDGLHRGGLRQPSQYNGLEKWNTYFNNLNH